MSPARTFTAPTTPLFRLISLIPALVLTIPNRGPQFLILLIQAKGWEEGEGLGKEKQGIKGYVRVLVQMRAFDTSQFDSILKRMKVKLQKSRIKLLKRMMFKRLIPMLP